MKLKDKSTIQRMLGWIEGISAGLDDKFSGFLLDAVEVIDGIIDREECEEYMIVNCNHHIPAFDVADVKHEEWTPVKEGLPRSRREYLCICVFGESERQYYNVLRFHPEKNAENGYVTGPHFSNEGMNGMRVTHWMPLPKPPCGD